MNARLLLSFCLLFVLAACQWGSTRQGARGFSAEPARNLVVEPSRPVVTGATRKLALVIGNNYTGEAQPLVNPGNDADAMRQTLRGLGFEVMGENQQTLVGMGALVRDFGDRLGTGTIGLFYFAGHGMQIKGRNYLIPVRAGIQREDEVPYRAFDANQVLAKMESAGSTLNLMILDACRNNPFARSFRSGTEGLAPMDAPSGTLIAYAAKPGTRSLDGTGANGLYTGTLLRYLTQHGIKIEDVFKRVRVDVKRQSNGEQIPWEEGALESDFCFAGCGLIPDLLNSPVETAVPLVVRKAQTTTAISKACEVCPEMVYLPGGSFMMGTHISDPERLSFQRQHRVVVDAFAIGKYEITQAEWRAVMGSNPSNYFGCDRCPVEQVAWTDIQEYLKKLYALTGQRYRLPTDAEWEYAARAGTQTTRYWGDNQDQACGYENVGDLTIPGEDMIEKGDYHDQFHNCSDKISFTAPVGSYKGNPFGLYDMLGNVYEWTCSTSEPGYFGSENTCTNKPKFRRWIRGGSWMSDPHEVRSTYRQSFEPEAQGAYLGFRVAKD